MDMDGDKNLYRVLGVAPDASLEAIKRAYRELVRQYHPDLRPGDHEAEVRIKAINAAYAALSRRTSEPFVRAEAGYDVTYPVRLSPSEARDGAMRSFSFFRPDGEPYEIRVRIPPGAWHGMRLCVPGAGGPARSGGRPGDFYVEVRVVPDTSRSTTR